MTVTGTIILYIHIHHYVQFSVLAVFNFICTYVANSPFVHVRIFTQADFEPAPLPNLTIADYCPGVKPHGNQNESSYNICLNLSLSLIQALHAVNLVLQNEECNNAAIPFLCNATFSLCSDNRLSLGLDLKEQCMQVRDDKCTIEWRVLENIFNVPIPSCDSFSVNGTLTFAKAPQLTCPDQFDAFCDSVCLPSCGEFSQNSYDATVASRVLTIIFEVIGLISGVITLLACLFNREKM